MNLTAKVLTVSVNVRESDHVEVEQIIRLYRDGVEIAKVPDKYVIAPDDDLTGKTDRAAEIAKKARTAKGETLIQIGREK